MKISEVIAEIKKYHNNTVHGKTIDEETTRDKVLYGDTDKECTGIVTTCFASTRVIREAAKLGCNLVIPHEALFWNHGDKTDWLAGNEVFQKKKALLDETGITVWRDHDYIHAGIPMGDGTYADGIFYGLAHELGWEQYVEGDPRRSMTFIFPEGVLAKDLALEMVEKMHLNGTRIVGDPDTVVRRANIAFHCIGQADNDVLSETEEKKNDCLLTMEITDFTVNEYVRDSAYLGIPRALIMIGHFNLEEPGMKYMVNWLPNVVGKDMPIHFVQSGDAYHYIRRF